jgi:tetratricopeptide (TPR) repeat protein
MAHLTRSAVIFLLLSSAGCAARGPGPAVVAELGKADALVRDGCHRCLENALAIYERLAAAPRAPIDAARGAFRAELLLALRAKELGLPPERWLARARERLASLPAVPPPQPSPRDYLDAATLVVGETSGFDPEERARRGQRFRTATPDLVPPARQALETAIDIDLTAAYVALSVDCEDARARKALKPERYRDRYGDIPLLQHRLALCAFGPAGVGAVRERDPRWIDTQFFEGRLEMTRRPVADVAKAAELFTSARADFPGSLAIAMALGTAQNALSEFQAALATFDDVLATDAVHRDALLGRVMSLSYLNRHPDAIAAATRMIELGTWHVGDAYYWRAWNRYHVYELEPAWTDIEHSTKLLVNTSVYTLAGFIAYARKQLDTAIDRFDRAYAMDSTNCEAVWTAGLVHVDQEAWTSAGPKFSRATTCFVAAAAQARDEIAQTQQATYAEAVKARRIAAAQKRVDTSEHRKAQAAYNAALSFVRAQQKTLALNHVDVAAEHSLFKEKAAALRATIEKLP